MLKKLVLTDDHIALISNLRFKVEDDGNKVSVEKDGCYGGTFIMEDIAWILGRMGEAVPGTESDPDGRKFPPETEDYFWGLHDYIWDNIGYVMSLSQQLSRQGGMKPGTYQCVDRDMIWKKIA